MKKWWIALGIEVAVLLLVFGGYYIYQSQYNKKNQQIMAKQQEMEQKREKQLQDALNAKVEEENRIQRLKDDMVSASIAMPPPPWEKRPSASAPHLSRGRACRWPPSAEAAKNGSSRGADAPSVQPLSLSDAGRAHGRPRRALPRTLRRCRKVATSRLCRATRESAEGGYGAPAAREEARHRSLPRLLGPWLSARPQARRRTQGCGAEPGE